MFTSTNRLSKVQDLARNHDSSILTALRNGVLQGGSHNKRGHKFIGHIKMNEPSPLPTLSQLPSWPPMQPAEARAKAAEARAEAAEARADEAEGRIVELKKKMVDEAHRIAFQQRIFNMELVQLEQDLDETRRSAVQQDKDIDKLMNYNDEAVQMINQLRQQRATLMAQITSALPTGSEKQQGKRARPDNSKPSAAACSSSVAASALLAGLALPAEASVAAVSPPARELGPEDCGGCHLPV